VKRGGQEAEGPKLKVKGNVELPWSNKEDPNKRVSVRRNTRDGMDEGLQVKKGNRCVIRKPEGGKRAMKIISGEGKTRNPVSQRTTEKKIHRKRELLSFNKERRKIGTKNYGELKSNENRGECLEKLGEGETFEHYLKKIHRKNKLTGMSKQTVKYEKQSIKIWKERRRFILLGSIKTIGNPEKKSQRENLLHRKRRVKSVFSNHPTESTGNNARDDRSQENWQKEHLNKNTQGGKI